MICGEMNKGEERMSSTGQKDNGVQGINVDVVGGFETLARCRKVFLFFQASAIKINFMIIY